MLFDGPDSNEWDRLAELNRNVFQTRDFAEAWWDAYRPKGEPVILSDSSENPHCIIPLYRSGGAVPVIRQIGHGPADELGPLCAPADRGLTAGLIRTELGRDLRRGVLVLHDAPAEGEWAERLDGDLIRTTPGPVVKLAATDWDAFLASRSKNFRGQVRRKHNRIKRNFDMTIRSSTSDTLDRDLAILFDLHRLRWGQDAPFAQGRQADLARRFAWMSVERDRLRLSVMELDGRPVAAMLGLRFAGVHAFWQSGRDPDYEQYSIGSVLLMDAIRAAVEDGAEEYRLLRGDEAYKQRLTEESRDTCTLAVSRGPVGSLAIRAARARRGMESRIRKHRRTAAASSEATNRES